MATHLDLEEQEQLDRLKAFWKQYGNLITWALIAVLGSFAGWNGWNWWQREQAANASGMFDELEKAVDAGDAVTGGKIFDDLKSRYPRTAFAQQAGLMSAKLQYEHGKVDDAQKSLRWVADEAIEIEYKSLAHFRLAGLLYETKQYDAALKELDAADAQGFEGLVADRRGDILVAQDKTDEAKAAYQKAWKALDDKLGFRRVVDAKLTALGAAPEGSK